MALFGSLNFPIVVHWGQPFQPDNSPWHGKTKNFKLLEKFPPWKDTH